MGLDMYMNATRSFGADAPETSRILSIANITLGDLIQMSQQDPMEHETYVYLSAWDHDKSDQPARTREILHIAGLDAIITDESPSGSLAWQDDKVRVGAHCMYWRKANAIHAWFVDNCQDGVDECQKSPVHVEQLAKLRQVCVDAIASYDAGDLTKAREILEPRSGFFFGGTDIDEWWAEDTRRTIAEIENVVNAALKIGGVEFSYQSSW